MAVFKGRGILPATKINVCLSQSYEKWGFETAHRGFRRVPPVGNIRDGRPLLVRKK